MANESDGSLYLKAKSNPKSWEQIYYKMFKQWWGITESDLKHEETQRIQDQFQLFD